MVAPGQKTKKKRKRRTAKGNRVFFVKGKLGKHSCALCGSQLHGVPHGKGKADLGKLGKTEKRPSVPFGGVLCVKCRRRLAEEKAMVENGLKDLNGVDLRLRKFLVMEETA